MARKSLWTSDQLKVIADEVKTKRAADASYTVKSYAEDHNIVYGTLYQALRRNGMFEPSRKRTRKADSQVAVATLETAAARAAANNSDILPGRIVENEVLKILDNKTETISPLEAASRIRANIEK